METQEIPQRPEAAADRDRAPRARPVLLWAAFGAVMVAAQVYTYVSWMASDDFTRIRPEGPVPTSHKVWANVLQALLVVGAVAVVFVVARQCVRRRRLTVEAIILIGWASALWLNPMENYLQPTRLASSYPPNFGTWVSHLPGAVSANSHRVPEPIVFMVALYFGYGALLTFACVGLMRRIKARRPVLAAPALIGLTYGAVVLLEVVGETLWVRTGLMTYAGGVPGLSLFGDSRFKVPIYLILLVSSTLTAAAALHYFRDERGDTIVERGIDRVRVSPRKRTRLRVLAVCGAFNAIVIAGYNVPVQLVAANAGPYPKDIPAYLNNGVCGDGTPWPCPGPGVPIHRRVPGS